jgi:trehalose-6-phosphate synthase
VLSQFTGASRELREAVLINPYHIEDFADRIKEAIEMPKEERLERMSKLRETIAENDIYNWANKFINELAKTLKVLRRA